MTTGILSVVPFDQELLDRIRTERRKLPESAQRSRPFGDADFERVSLPERDADVLRDLILSENAQSVIEIGLAYRSSALAIGEALVAIGSEQSTHLILDPYQDRFEHAGWNVIASAGIDGFCTLLSERSQLALPRLVGEGFVADAAFVDGSHIFHNVFVDLYYLRELLRPGGLIVLDDCKWPSVGTAVNYYLLNAGWTSERITESTRLRAFRLPEAVLEPSFEAFRPFQI